jgi:hypothetical protein
MVDERVPDIAILVLGTARQVLIYRATYHLRDGSASYVRLVVERGELRDSD